MRAGMIAGHGGTHAGAHERTTARISKAQLTFPGLLDQAWIESLNGHLKAEYPHLLAIRDPATLRAELAITRPTTTGSGCTPASATSPPTTNTKDAVRPSARLAKPAWNRPGSAGLPGTASTGTLHPPGTPTMLANRTRSCVTNSDTRQLRTQPLSSRPTHRSDAARSSPAPSTSTGGRPEPHMKPLVKPAAQVLARYTVLHNNIERSVSLESCARNPRQAGRTAVSGEAPAPDLMPEDS